MAKSLRNIIWIFIGVGFLLILPYPVWAVTTVTSYTTNAASVPKFAKFESTFQISRTFPAGSFLPYYFYDSSDTPSQYPGRNSPYGVDGISIDAIFTAPSGNTLKVPAFYFQDYQRSGDTMTPTSNYSWKIRFAPEEVGQYSYYLSVQDKDGTSRYPATGSLSFQSTTSSLKGFIRVSPRDSRFFEFENGESFIPNGSGRQWWRPGRTTSYESSFTDFKNNNINFTRIWDQNDGYGLTVEGHFDGYKYPDDASLGGKDDVARALPKGTQMNQRGNYEEDIILNAAEQNGIYIQLCSHGDPYWIWDASIYAEGWNPSPVSYDNQFHINYWKRNFRYRVARWGYSTALLGWETWNEHGHIPSNTDVYRFYQTYSTYMQQTDPYHHLRTTSQGSQSWSPGFWSSSAMDYANYHDYMMISRYPAELTYDAANFVYRFAQCLRTANGSTCGLGIGDGSSWSGNQKPYIWGELDTSTSTWNEANPQPKAAHASRWAGLFSPIGNSGLDWFFDQQSSSFISTKYAEAKIVGNYFKGVDYAGKRFSYLSTDDVKLTSQSVSTTNTSIRVLAMRAQNNSEVYAWVQNKNNARWDQAVNTSALSGSFTVPGITNGTYRVETWDTYTGQVSQGSDITVTNGNLIVSVSNLSKDIAMKIISGQPSVTVAPSGKLGDANGDGKVNGSDYVIWLTHYGQLVSGASVGDFNNSGKVDGLDFTTWLTHYSP